MFLNHKPKLVIYPPEVFNSFISQDFKGLTLKTLVVEEALKFLSYTEKEFTRSITEFGIKEPVVIMVRNGEKIIVDGHHRAVVASKLNLNLNCVVLKCNCKDASLNSCLKVKEYLSKSYEKVMNE